MKKTLSVVLAIAMIFLLSVPAFAENNSLKLGETKSVTVSDADETFRFIAEEQGVYSLKGKASDKGKVNVDLIHDNKCVMSECIGQNNYIYSEDHIYEFKFCAEKGSEFDIVLKNANSDRDNAVSLDFVIEKYDAPAVVEGTNNVEVTGTYFIFVPDKSGMYNFRTTEADIGYNPTIGVYDVNGLVGYNAFNGKTIMPQWKVYRDSNFDLTVNLEKGKIYGIDCKNGRYINYDTLHDYNFTMSYDKVIMPEEIVIVKDCNINDAEGYITKSFPVTRGETNEYSLLVVPSGAKPNAKSITVKSDNEDVLSASINAEGNLVLEAKKFGVARLTFTTENGFTQQNTVFVELNPQYIGLGLGIFAQFVSWLCYVFVYPPLFLLLLFFG